MPNPQPNEDSLYIMSDSDIRLGNSRPLKERQLARKFYNKGIDAALYTHKPDETEAEKFFNDLILGNDTPETITITRSQMTNGMASIAAHYAAKEQEEVLRARIEETESTYQTLQEYLLEDMDSDEITTQLQEDLRQYRSDLTNQLNQMKGEK